MTKAILTTKLTPAYNDIPERQYHFPRTYLRQMELAVGDLAIYYEPRRISSDLSSSGGRQSYFAVVCIAGIRPDPDITDHYYADIENYLDFDKPVPFKMGADFLESALERDGGQTNKGAFGRSVRNIPENEFDAIIAAGFSEQLPFQSTLPAHVLPGFAEDQTPFERRFVETVITKPFREESFRRHVRDAYDKRCAVTGLRLINGGGRPEVQAAHIMPVASNGPDSVRNGVALSGTVHWLFDRGLISISDELTLIAPKKLIPESLAPLVQNKRPLFLPKSETNHPHRSFIEYHRNSVFKG